MTLALVFKATVILAAVATVSAILRKRSAALRHAIWTAALAALIAMPFTGGLLPSWSALPALKLRAFGAAAAETAAFSLKLSPVWYAGIFLVLARLVLSHLLLWRMARRGTVTAPVTWGILRPEILLPGGSADASVVGHERAHVERRDGLWLAVSQLACAVWWFHPLVWLAAARAREEAERACDDRVLSGGAGSVEYAGALVACARMASTPAALASTDSLEKRLRSILNPGTDRSDVSPRLILAVVLAVVAVAGPVAMLSRAQGPVGMDALDIPPRLLSKVEPQYTEEARQAKIAGTCVLSVIVGPDGLAREIEVRRSLDEGLDAKAIEAVEQWVFEPGIKDGSAVPVRATIEVNFRLM
ncbi:MAG: M56 family metallopeptidase [Bryobacteraceae bacterium]